jgi:hypothetical protein
LYDRGQYLLQWRWTGNRSEAFAYAGGDGRIDLQGGGASIELSAADFHDNSASVRFDIEPEPDPPALDAAGKSSGIGTFELACYGEFLVLTASFSLPEHAKPTATVEGGTGEFFRVDTKTFRATVAPESNARSLRIEAVHPRAEPFVSVVNVFTRDSEPRTIAIGNARLELAPLSAYGTLFVLHREPASTPTHETLELVTKPFSIWPENAPIDENVRLTIPLPQDETRGRAKAVGADSSRPSPAEGLRRAPVRLAPSPCSPTKRRRESVPLKFRARDRGPVSGSRFSMPDRELTITRSSRAGIGS